MKKLFNLFVLIQGCKICGKNQSETLFYLIESNCFYFLGDELTLGEAEEIVSLFY